MFTKVSKILGQFITDPPGIPVRLRVMVATCAFGLGIDFPDIVRVVNWGSPNTLEDLVQQSGRVGRNGISTESILIYKNPGRNVSNVVTEYGENTVMCT